MNTIQNLKLAVLIDAENVPHANIKGMLEEITKYGTPTTKRIYTDWTSPRMSNWKKVLLENAITPIQQYSYTKGKNATDSAMIIDAMDILYSGRVDGFCIVSSDSDFTRLATRLREAGMKVIGIGEKKTPTPFITACDKFIYLEIIEAEDTTTNTTINKKAVSDNNEEKITAKPKETLSKIDRRLINLIRNSVNDLGDEDGWAFLGDLGNIILKKQPDFDPRNYGFSKMLPLIKSINSFIVDERETGKANIKHVYVKNR
ncbi:NYN domain-containing protein [Flavobacterium sp. LaA7.5]|nr:NYN domain-containing protein [Flavobacterium salilacus subsp. altitudinum]